MNRRDGSELCVGAGAGRSTHASHRPETSGHSLRLQELSPDRDCFPRIERSISRIYIRIRGDLNASLEPLSATGSRSFTGSFKDPSKGLSSLNMRVTLQVANARLQNCCVGPSKRTLTHSVSHKIHSHSFCVWFRRCKTFIDDVGPEWLYGTAYWR